MKKQVDLSIVSRNLSPKERAKLVIKLVLKGWSEVKDDPEAEISTAADVKAVVAASPRSEGQEYNQYIGIKEDVWSRLMPLLESLLQELRLRESRVAQVLYMLALAPMSNQTITMIERQPVIVTREEYDEAVRKAKQLIRNEVLELEGLHGIVQEEAYASLLAQGEIEENGTYLDGWADYMDRYGKTDEELIAGSVKSIKEGREHYLKYKARLPEDKEPRLWNHWKQFVGDSDEELAEYVRGKQPDDLMRPPKKMVELWRAEVTKQRQRVEEAIKTGQLAAQDEGISLGSYYDWPERISKYGGEEGGEEKDYNPLSEDCIELRYYHEHGVRFTGDPEMLKLDDYGCRIVIATDNESYMAKHSWDNKQALIEFVDVNNPVKVTGSRDINDDIRTIKFSNKLYIKVLKHFKEHAEGLLQEMTNYLALVEAIEEKHFDSMEIVSRDPDHPLGTVPRVKEEIVSIPQGYNDKLTNVTADFAVSSGGMYEYVFPEINDLLLNMEYQVDKEWLTKHIADVEERGSRN